MEPLNSTDRRLLRASVILAVSFVVWAALALNVAPWAQAAAPVSYCTAGGDPSIHYQLVSSIGNTCSGTWGEPGISRDTFVSIATSDGSSQWFFCASAQEQIWVSKPSGSYACSYPLSSPYTASQYHDRAASWGTTLDPDPSTLGGPPPAADGDGDGVPDSSDACPTVAGTGSDGCPPDVAPAVDQAPAIPDTTPVQDVAFSATAGSYSGTPTPTVASQWFQCDSAGNGCSAISGATGLSYTPTAGDVGETLYFSQTATNRAGSVTSSTGVSQVVDPQGGTGTATVPPGGQAMGDESNIANDVVRPVVGLANSVFGDGGGVAVAIMGSVFLLALAVIGVRLAARVVGREIG